MAEQDTMTAAVTGERAIIDIGSNTVRMVIYGGPPRAPVVMHNEKVAARLGKAVADTGLLGDKATRQALAALGRYATVLRLRGIRDVRTVATAAVRDATNGPDFLARVADLGLSPRLLSGEEEAMASARGVMASFPGAKGMVGDLGGGSLELIDIDGLDCVHGTSLPLGTLRLPALRSGGGAKFARRVRKMLGAADWVGDHGQTLYLVGGSWRALARFAMQRVNWPIDDPHGFELTAEEALNLARSLTRRKEGMVKAGVGKSGIAKAGGGKVSAGKTKGVAAMATRGDAARRSVKLTRAIGAGWQQDAGDDAADQLTVSPLLAGAMPVSAARLASLPDAAALLAVLVRELRPARLVFSSWGLREGLLVGGLVVAPPDPAIDTPGADAGDPMLTGVRAFVAQQGADLPARAETVVAWTASVLPRRDAGAERLRRAATMLALASLRTEPNLRPGLAVNWALRKRWVGISAEGRAMLAVAMLANSGRTAIAPDLTRLAGPARLREALVWGLATRLCRRFTAGAEAALSQSRLCVEEDALVLSMDRDIAVLCNDGVEKDLRLLGECLGMSAEVRVRADS